MGKPAVESKNSVAQASEFFSESWEELKKVHPPTRQETVQATIVVLIMVAIFSIFLALTDLLIGNIMEAVLTA